MGRTVVSLLPSCTDTVVALGLHNRLIGRSHEVCGLEIGWRAHSIQHLTVKMTLQCDWDEVQVCPVLTSSRVGNIPIEEIDDVFSASVAAVEEMKMMGPGLARMLLEFGLSVYKLDTQLLESLKPDVILTCLQTAHSCVLEGELRDIALESVLGYVPKVVHCNGQSLEQIWQDMQSIADALDESEKGRELVKRERMHMESLEASYKDKVEQSLACIQWAHPMMTCGAWVSELIAKVGAHEVVGEQGAGGVIQSNELESSDIIVFALCGVPLEVSRRVVEKLKDQLSNTTAFRKGRIAVLDGVRMMSRPGPLLKQSLECLVEITAAREPAHRSGSAAQLSQLAAEDGHQGKDWAWV